MRVDETWYTAEQLCERFEDLTPAGLANQRYRGVGPRGVRVGRRVYYAASDVQEWLEGRADDPRPSATETPGRRAVGNAAARRAAQGRMPRLRDGAPAKGASSTRSEPLSDGSTASSFSPTPADLRHE